jgi:hypothetical protein
MNFRPDRAQQPGGTAFPVRIRWRGPVSRIGAWLLSQADAENKMRAVRTAEQAEVRSDHAAHTLSTVPAALTSPHAESHQHFPQEPIRCRELRVRELRSCLVSERLPINAGSTKPMPQSPDADGSGAGSLYRNSSITARSMGFPCWSITPGAKAASPVVIRTRAARSPALNWTPRNEKAWLPTLFGAKNVPKRQTVAVEELETGVLARSTSEKTLPKAFTVAGVFVPARRKHILQCQSP